MKVNIKICYLVMLNIMCLTINQASAQTFAEWFKQNKTQKKYLIAQVVALQAYIGQAKEGYKIVKTGLNTVNDIKYGDFNLHQLFYTSLKRVGIAIKKYPRSADILIMQADILNRSKSNRTGLRKTDLFSSDELNYLDGVYSLVLKDCEGILTDLTDVTTNGKLEMTDDQRLERIDQLHKQMQKIHTFVFGFSNENTILALLQEREKLGKKE